MKARAVGVRRLVRLVGLCLELVQNVGLGANWLPVTIAPPTGEVRLTAVFAKREQTRIIVYGYGLERFAHHAAGTAQIVLQDLRGCRVGEAFAWYQEDITISSPRQNPIAERGIRFYAELTPVAGVTSLLVEAGPEQRMEVLPGSGCPPKELGRRLR